MVITEWCIGPTTTKKKDEKEVLCVSGEQQQT